MKKLRWAALLLAGLIPLTAQAASIEGMLEDEAHEWFVVSQGNDSSASFMQRGDELHIDITGFREPRSEDARDALAMSLIVQQEALTEAKVVQLINGTTVPPLYTSEGGDVTVTLSHFERDGPQVHIVGRVEGSLALQTQLGSAPEPRQNISVDVNFDVKARKVAF